MRGHTCEATASSWKLSAEAGIGLWLAILVYDQVVNLELGGSLWWAAGLCAIQVFYDLEELTEEAAWTSTRASPTLAP